MNDAQRQVIDASALLAYFHAEAGAEAVEEALADGCSMSMVNWAEVLSKVAELGKPSRDFLAELADRKLLGTALHLVPFDLADAAVVGDLRPLTRPLGLSLGDRACLALATRLGAPVLTADRAWSELEPELEIPIRLIR